MTSDVLRGTLLVLLLALVPSPASAVTTKDVVSLSKAGVSDEVLLALIDRDKTIFTLDPDQLIALRNEGVSEAVVLAMLKSGRQEPPDAPSTRPPQTPLVSAEPDVLIVGHGPDRPNTYHEYDYLGVPRGGYGGYPLFVVPVPVAVPAPFSGCSPAQLASVRSRPADTTGQFGRFMNDPGARFLADPTRRFLNAGFIPANSASEAAAVIDCSPAEAGGRRDQRSRRGR